jgi:hypothetical protein
MKEMERIHKEKIRLLKAVLAETEKQGGMIAQRDLDGLNLSIADRQTLMDEFDALDGSIRKGRSAPAGASETVLESIRVEIHAILADIIRKDAENKKNAGEWAGTLMAGIRETNMEKSLLAYQSTPDSGNRFINKKG